MNDDYSSRSDREGRFGPGLLLWMFVVGLLLAMTATFFWNNSYEHILISDLLRLVEATQLDEKHQLVSGSSGYIDVYSSKVEEGYVRYSGLTGVIMSKTEIRGEVTKQFFKPVEANVASETTSAGKETGKAETVESAKSTITPVEVSKQESPKTDSVAVDSEKVIASSKEESTDAKTITPAEPKAEKIYFITRLHESDAETIAKLLKEHGIVRRNAEPNFWTDYAPWIMLMMLLTLFAIMLLRKIGAAGNPMAFGRSRGKLYAMEELGITFNDVAGIDEAVEEVKEIVDFLRNAEKYQSLGGRIPKGVLLVGPPGTGKTLLAKAIAGEAGVPFFSLSGSDFVEMFVGVGAARVRDMFLQAEDKAPCIIFIDELDALGKSRGSGLVGGHDEREQTLNALLVEMDGFGSNSGVIVMAATNRPETLDPALLRPGRFDRHVLVDRPDIRGREAILKVHVKNVKLDPVVDLKRIASITPGFVGADLANLVNEAALLAARKGKTAVGMDEFNEGVERVQIGLEKKQRVMNDDEKLRVAYHESGHAVVAFSLPNTDPVHKVSIIPRGIGALGYVLRRPEGDRFLRTQQELESNIQVALAGTLAEEIFLGDVSTGNQSDLEHSTEIARGMVMEYGMSQLGRINYREKSSSLFLAGAGDDRPRSHSEETARQIDVEVQRIVNDALERTRHILETRRDAVEALARKLMVVESVDSEELKKIIDANTKGPLVVPGTDIAPKANNVLPSNGDIGPLTAEGRN